MTDALSQLKTLTNDLHALPETDWQKFQSIWKPYSAKRKICLTKTGETERYLYFVVDGVQRVYYSDAQGREATLVFTYNPSFGGVLDSFMSQQPSRYHYETLTASSFLRASYAEFKLLVDESPAIASMIQIGLTGAMGGVLLRLAELQCFSSEEKFRSLLKRSPGILHLVPHKYLANYLGIDATNFSKFINKIAI